MAFAVSKWFYTSILGWQSLARKAAYLLVCPPLLLAVSEFLSETAPARFPILRVSSPPPVTNIRMCQKANRRSKLTPSSRSHGRRKTDEEENLHLRFHRTQGNRQRLLRVFNCLSHIIIMSVQFLNQIGGYKCCQINLKGLFDVAV